MIFDGVEQGLYFWNIYRTCVDFFDLNITKSCTLVSILQMKGHLPRTVLEEGYMIR